MTSQNLSSTLFSKILMIRVFEDKSIHGDYNELGIFIREFFRRKGIQLYHE